MKHRWPLPAAMVGVALVTTIGGARQVPAIAAGALLRPMRRPLSAAPPAFCAPAALRGEGVTLAAWQCETPRPKRGTVVYLHGVADNRGSSAGMIQQLLSNGFDAIAYDSRAHGESTGEHCTYGFYEKADLRRVIDSISVTPVIVIGTSLGAAVALQAAAEDTRIATVIAAETFSDLRTAARERAPLFLTSSIIDRAFVRAEREARFAIDDVSPASAARRIRAPVLLLHGALDRETPPEHSERVFAALRGPKRLIVIPGAGHNDTFRRFDWKEIERWLTGLNWSNGAVVDEGEGLRFPVLPDWSEKLLEELSWRVEPLRVSTSAAAR